MTEAIFGFIGVLVGALIPWFQTYWTEQRATRKNGRYLAIRIVCVLDKYLESCMQVVKDEGLSYGQRTKDGLLQAQVKAPGAPVYPEDVDWKSINHELMYRLLSLPSEVETAERLIKGTQEFAGPPDFEDWFLERAYWYCQFGLTACKLIDELCYRYEIKKTVYNDWNPQEDFASNLKLLQNRRQRRIEEHAQFVKKVLRKQ